MREVCGTCDIDYTNSRSYGSGEVCPICRHEGRAEEKSEYGDERECLVIRCADPFTFEDFEEVVGKVVRKGHVSTDSHWKEGEIERNGVAEGVR